MESLQRVRTDFSPDALQKAVSFSADGALLATGGADGFLRLWEVSTEAAGHGRGCGARGSQGRHRELGGSGGAEEGRGGLDVDTVG